MIEKRELCASEMLFSGVQGFNCGLRVPADTTVDDKWQLGGLMSGIAFRLKSVCTKSSFSLGKKISRFTCTSTIFFLTLFTFFPSPFRHLLLARASLSELLQKIRRIPITPFWAQLSPLRLVYHLFNFYDCHTQLKAWTSIILHRILLLLSLLSLLRLFAFLLVLPFDQFGRTNIGPPIPYLRNGFLPQHKMLFLHLL